MRRPTPKGSGSSWIYLKTGELPKGVSLIFKSEQRCVDLQFENTRATDLQAFGPANGPDEVRVAPRGKHAAERLAVPGLDMGTLTAEQRGAVAGGIAAPIPQA